MIINLVSLNIWDGKLLTAALEFLKQQDADIVLLQEVTNATNPAFEEKHRIFEVLNSELNYPYSDYAHNLNFDLDGKIVPEGNAILSKLPIKKSSSLYFIEPDRKVYQDIPEHWPIVPRILQQVELQSGDLSINVINVHGVWDLDGDNDSPERRRMVQVILEAADGLPNVILGGDSNASQGNPIWQEVKNKLQPATDYKTGDSTFNMRRKDNPGYASAAVDVIYVSANIKVHAAECLNVDISDHLPLVVSLDIP